MATRRRPLLWWGEHASKRALGALSPTPKVLKAKWSWGTVCCGMWPRAASCSITAGAALARLADACQTPASAARSAGCTASEPKQCCSCCMPCARGNRER
jgi:hypothetical protein